MLEIQRKVQGRQADRRGTGKEDICRSEHTRARHSSRYFAHLRSFRLQVTENPTQMARAKKKTRRGNYWYCCKKSRSKAAGSYIKIVKLPGLIEPTS